MTRNTALEGPTSHDTWTVSQAAAYLTNQACLISARHISDGVVRLQFNREVAYYARGIVKDVEEGRKTVEQGLQDIKDEQSHLVRQSRQIATKAIGLVAGGLQLATGAGVCYASVGTLCAFVGVPIMAHGANNMYENGRNLIQARSNTTGPVRQGYHQAVKAMGYGEDEADILYGGVDIAMSIYSLSRLVIKPDAWRLFRYLPSDKVRAYKKMGGVSLGVEAYIDADTAVKMYERMPE
ncbi:DUF4225 domain-containing protein [Pseudomonas kitaguniensis]|uniref:DUF4225 domain-containing protein n=1 Tax=Pseudomonas kitaguniensis TaxID=2607908 RepID=UPI001561D26F